MKNQGISLISLIITIIVIIILAAIVIFSGMDTPERAQLSNFAQQVSNVHSAVLDQLTDVTIKHATSGEVRTAAQLYGELARNVDLGQDGTMEIVSGADSLAERIDEKKSEESINLKLPTVREDNTAWYVTADGKVFNASGFVSGNKTYFTADLFADGSLPRLNSSNTSELKARATVIAEELLKGTTGEISVSTENVQAPSESGE